MEAALVGRLSALIDRLMLPRAVRRASSSVPPGSSDPDLALPAVIRDRFRIVPRFFSGARAARAALDEHFGSPQTQHLETHAVWNYWYSPPLYTYLRADPAKVLGSELVDRFVAELRAWSSAQLGLAEVMTPILSTFVAGCVQGLHNDSENGTFAYVYSLTEWDRRMFLGGETLLMSEEPYFGSERLTRAGSGSLFYDLVPQRFNQLLVFDDRIPHAVPRIEGTMDPAAGRIVLHGHLRVSAPLVEWAPDTEGSAGARADVEATISAACERVRAGTAADGPPCHGFLSWRVPVDSEGAAGQPEILCDRVLSLDARPPPAGLAERAKTELFALRFSPAAGVRSFTCAIVFGAKVTARPPSPRAATSAPEVLPAASTPRFAPGLRRSINASLAGGTSFDDTLAGLVRDGHDRVFAEAAMVHAMFELPDPGKPRLPEPMPHGPTPVRHAAGRAVRVLASLASPRVVLLGGLLSDEECDELVARARSKVARSTVVDRDDGESVVDPVRTSSDTTLATGDDAFLRDLDDRIAALVAWPVAQTEAFQITSYPPHARNTSRTTTISRRKTRGARRTYSPAAATASARSSSISPPPRPGARPNSRRSAWR